MTDDDLLAEARRRFIAAETHHAAWRAEAREDYAFVAGDQWSAEDRHLLLAEGRPAIVFNRVAPMIDAVAGTEIANRQEVRFLPRELGDVAANEVLTAAARWVRDRCDAADEESDAFFDALVCGMGWTETALDFETDPDGHLIVQRVDPLEMLWDPAATRRNLGDARYLFRLRDLPRGRVLQLWGPDALDGTGAAPWDRAETGLPGLNAGPGHVGAGGSGTVRVVEYQWAESEPVYRLERLGRAPVELPADRFLTLKARAEAEGIPFAAGREWLAVSRRRVRRAFLAGGKVLAAGPSPCPFAFTYRPLTAKRDRNAGQWYGLVRAMKDPQRWANKFFSQLLHIVNANAKGGIVAETDAFDDARKAEEDWARPDAIVWTRPGTIRGAKIQPRGAPPIPPGLEQLLGFALGAMREVSGINLELLGLADRAQPGVLERQRKKAGLAILSTLFDSLRRYRKEQGRVLLHFILEHLGDGRLVRIAGETGARWVPLVRRPGTAEFDVVVDEAPTSPDQKEEVWQVLAGLFPTLREVLTPAAIAEMLRYAPLPQSLTAKLAAEVEKAGA